MNETFTVLGTEWTQTTEVPSQEILSLNIVEHRQV